MIDLRHGDMRDVLPTIEAESVHSVVTDPPYGLEFMGKDWDKFATGRGRKYKAGGSLDLTNIAERSGKGGAGPSYINRPAKRCAGCGRQAWSGSPCQCESPQWESDNSPLHAFQAFNLEWARAVHRVLKPGGYLLAMGGTRTFHRLACAIEDAGFEVRDTIGWLYGQGFPKSLNLGNGWGTALKPAMELICVARKPLSERTVAANVLRHGTGGINVDACRVESGPRPWREKAMALSGDGGNVYGDYAFSGSRVTEDTTKGRWPPNLAHDGSSEVEAAFAAFGESAPSRAAERGLQHSGRHGGLADLGGNLRDGTNTVRGHDDAGGSPSRFFYSSKAGAGDRADSRHPTIKPVDLMRWLTRLVTPPGGTVLDPFAGSGTTGEAAMLEGFNAILIEREAEHHADIQHRQRRWHGGDLPLFAEAAE